MLKVALMSLVALLAFAVPSKNVSADEGHGMPAGCRSIVPLGSLIYKGCAGSGHLSKDPRGKGIALIARAGYKKLKPSKCMPIYNHEGETVGGMHIYSGNLTPPKGPYQWRAYSNYVSGCGKGLTQSKLKKMAKNQEVYIRVNSTAKQCIKIEKAYSNKNSSQKC
jgi:hypothetical protein